MKALDSLRRLGKPNEPSAPDPILLTAIGVVRASNRDLRHRDSSRQRAAIEVNARFAPALVGLEGFSHLIVLTWLDRVSDEERATVQERIGTLPPLGVFALRTHHRPNPIGLTVVRIERVRESSVDVVGLDVVDRTPVLDLKPYLPPYDAVPDAGLPAWASGGPE